MRLDVDQVWREILLRVREDSGDMASFLEANATMRLEDEVREVMIAGGQGLKQYLHSNPILHGVLTEACDEVLGWDRFCYERLDLPEMPSPSGYLFYIDMCALFNEEDEPEAASPTPLTPFDEIKITMEDGSERWSARQLAELLGYGSWQNFQGALSRAKQSCEASGDAVSDQFMDVHKLITHGKGGKRRQHDIYLTRLGAYLVAMNGDTSKPMIGQAQRYFATQARRMELMDQLREDARRVRLRGEISAHQRQLAEAARDAGIISVRDFGIFQNWGYMGLYNGERAADIKARKRLGPNDSPLDAMGFDELAANFFRVSLTEQRLKRERPAHPHVANEIHHEVGQATRQTIIDQGGTLPEHMPTADHIRNAAKRLRGVDLSEIELLDSPEQD